MTQAPLIITMGDPSGIGPEISVKSLLGKNEDCVIAGSAFCDFRALSKPLVCRSVSTRLIESGMPSCKTG